MLDLPSLAPVNLHFSLLPELRGAAPVQRAILEGLPVTGVTTIRMDAGTDTGPILLRAEESVDPDDDAGSLGERLAAIGGRLLVDTLARLEAERDREVPQDGAAATYAPKLTAVDRVIDWSQPAESVVRRVRAMAPDPGAVTGFRGRGLKVLRARRTGPVPNGSTQAPSPLRPGKGWPSRPLMAWWSSWRWRPRAGGACPARSSSVATVRRSATSSADPGRSPSGSFAG